ncbi:cholesterol esterase [Quaeritorhiza haematococci]|nr:cholesterol esterase [Quaeritorhiza haematococci]
MAADMEKELVDTIASIQRAAGLIRLWNFPCEEHVAETADGFLIGLQRIPHEQFGARRSKDAGHAHFSAHRPPVLLWHGLALSSEIFVCNVSPEMNLALVLASAGFDVWLGNFRGNHYSNKHKHLKPDDPEYWHYGIDELANFDIPAAVNYILSVTGYESLSYVGYSQGTAAVTAALSLHEDLNHKINAVCLLAPALRPAPLANRYLMALIQSFGPEFLFNVLGRGAFIPWVTDIRNTLSARLYAMPIDGAFHYLFGWKCRNFGPKYRKKALYAHLFAHTSMKTVVHWFQIIHNAQFQTFDQRKSSFIPSPTRHSINTPPVKFPTRHIKTKVYMYCGGDDTISDPEHLKSVMPSSTVIKVIEGYEHLDFLWAEDVKERVWDEIISVLRSHCQEAPTEPIMHSTLNVKMAEQHLEQAIQPSRENLHHCGPKSKPAPPSPARLNTRGDAVDPWENHEHLASEVAVAAGKRFLVPDMAAPAAENEEETSGCIRNSRKRPWLTTSHTEQRDDSKVITVVKSRVFLAALAQAIMLFPILLSLKQLIVAFEPYLQP